MARIRIVDEWLRSPVAGASRYRAIMVVADSWGEQRVLMRAFATSPDQTRPTIVLHGTELAVGPAGVEAHGQWGIHVEPPADGRAQELRGQLEFAAKRLAGSKGTPPRLEDEAPKFERERTNNWAPGTPRDLPKRSEAPTVYGANEAATIAPAQAPSVPGYYEPAMVAAPSPKPVAPPSPSSASKKTVVLQGGPIAGQRTPAVPAQPPSPTPPAGFALATSHCGWTSPVPNEPAREVGSTTAIGYAVAPKGKPRAAGKKKAKAAARLSNVVSYTMPLGFRLDKAEREVLNTLGEADSLTAREVGQIVGISDGVAWMEALMIKLAEHGLDLVAPGDDIDGEPTYWLCR